MMPISSKGRFASRIVVFLASQPPGARVTKFEIGREEAISPDYVEQLMVRLKVAGLVASHRGRAGGFSLACDPGTTSVAEVLRAVEGRVAPAPCYSPHDCERSPTCPTRDVWMEAARLLDDLFGRTTIAQLARVRQEKLELVGAAGGGPATGGGPAAGGGPDGAQPPCGAVSPSG